MQTQIKNYPQKAVLWSGDLELVSVGQVILLDSSTFTVMRSYLQLGSNKPSTQILYARRGGTHVESVPRPAKREGGSN